MKTNKCKLCGWGGRTHIHHIIPKRHYGEKFSDEKEKALKEGCFLYFDCCWENQTKKQLKKLVDIMKKYDFDKIDFVAYMMGVTRKFIEQSYVEGNINKKLL